MVKDKTEMGYYKSLEMNTKTEAFKSYYKAGLLENVDESFINEVKQYWQKHYHKNVDPMIHIAFMNYTGEKEPRIVDPRTSWNEIIPFLNDQQMNSVYQDKNLYDLLIPTERSVETVLKRAHGLYFDQHNNFLDKSAALTELLSYKQDFIVKPSNTNNGQGIKKLYYREDYLFLDDEKLHLDALEEMYGANFAVQKVVQQHAVMSEPHPDSVNTLRMVTLRWKDEIRYLLTFAKFGAQGKVLDNTSSGGVSIGVKDNGEFMDTALDRSFKVHAEHPTTGVLFKDMQPIPNFDQFKQYVTDLHKPILHHDFISWDIAVGADGLPVFLEANFKGGTWFYQLLAERPLFGDLTEEILEYMHKERNDKHSPRFKSFSKNQPSVKKLNKRVQTLKNDNQQLQKERDRIDKKYNNILDSKSWRMTQPIRKLSSLFKR
ncbi:sugar-transfer associated ATP-grasp domain-containing protein [Salinicoccus albus]|uniref:sugar-transfer associated ATP-grasp domain-containing protein n=1 Tax=Salinicoccus albus TaxID=418756 RepID=UPI0003769FDE|nr:sugar-transfer associated ATP-grasp domain-containing protein [Salinicoccus albus]